MRDKELKPSDIARELCRRIQYHINEATLSDAQAEVILFEFWQSRPQKEISKKELELCVGEAISWFPETPNVLKSICIETLAKAIREAMEGKC